MQGQNFIKNILICVPKMNEGLMCFGMTYGWVINDKISIVPTISFSDAVCECWNYDFRKLQIVELCCNNGSCKQWLKIILGNATQVQLFILFNIATSQTLIILFREVEIESITAVVWRKREANKQFANVFYLGYMMGKSAELI